MNWNCPVIISLEKPTPSENELLIEIHAGSLNAADYKMIQMGFPPKKKIFISDISVMAIDFTDLDPVRKVTKDILIRFPEIYGLILSVGYMVQNGPNIYQMGMN